MDAPKLPVSYRTSTMNRYSNKDQISALKKSIMEKEVSEADLRGNNAQLKVEFRTIGERLKMAIVACDNLNREKEDLEGQLNSSKEDLAAEKEKAKEQIKKMTEKTKSISKSMAKDKEEVIGLRKKKEVVDSKLLEMGKMIQDLEKKTCHLEGEELKKGEQLRESNAKIKAMEDASRNKKNRIAEKDKMLQQKQTKIESLENSLEVMQKSNNSQTEKVIQEMKHLKKVNAQLQAQIDESNSKSVTSKQEHERLQMERIELLEEKEMENEKHLKDIADWKSNFQSLNEVKDNFLHEKEQREREVKELQSKFVETKKKIGAVEEANDGLLKENLLMKNQLSKALQDLGHALEEKDGIDNQYKASLSKYENLETRNTDLEKAVKDTYSKYEQSKEQAKHTEESRNTLKQQKSDMKNKYKRTKEELVNLRNIIQKCEKENEDQKNHILQLQESNSDFENKYSVLDEQHCQALKQLKAAEKSSEDCMMIVNELKVQYTQTTGKLEEVQKHKDELEVEKSQLKNNCTQNEADIMIIREQLTELNNRYSLMTRKHDEARNELNENKEEQFQLQSQLSGVSKLLENAEVECKKVADEKNKLDNENADIRNANRDMKSEYANAKVELQSFEENHNELFGKYTQLKEELESAVKEKHKIEGELNELHGRHVCIKEELCNVKEAKMLGDSNHSKLMADFDNVKSKLQKMKQQNCTTQDELLTSKERYDQAKQEVLDIGKKYHEIETSNKKLEKMVSDLKAALRRTDHLKIKSKENINKLEKRCEELIRTLEDAKSSKAQLNKKVSNLNQQNKELNEEFVSAKHKHTELTKELITIKQRHNEAKEEMKNVEKVNDSLERDLAKLNQEHQKLTKELCTVKRSNTQHKKLCEKQKEAIAQTSSKLDLLRKDNECLKEENVSLSQDLNKLKNAESAKENEVEQQELQFNTINQELQTRCDEIETLKSEHSTFKSRIEPLLTTLQEYKRRNEKHGDINAKIKSAEIQNHAYHSLVMKYDNLKKLHDKLKLDVLRNNGKELSLDFDRDDLTSENTQLLQDKDRLEQKNAEIILAKEALEEKLKDNEALLRNEKQNLETKEEELKQLIDTMSGSKAALVQQLKQERKEYEENLSKARIDSLREILSDQSDAEAIVAQMSTAEKVAHGLSDDLRVKQEEKDLSEMKITHLQEECKIFEKHIDDLEHQVEQQRFQIQDAQHENKETIKVLGGLRLERDLKQFNINDLQLNLNEGQIVPEDVTMVEGVPSTSTPRDVLPAFKHDISAISPVSGILQMSPFGANTKRNTGKDNSSSVITNQQNGVNDTPNLNPGLDSHKALEMRHSQVVVELEILHQNLQTIQEEKDSRIKELEETLDLENRQNQSHDITDDTCPTTPTMNRPFDNSISVKERVVRLMKNNVVLQQEKDKLHEMLKEQENLVQNLTSTIDENACGDQTNGSPSSIKDITKQQISLLQSQRDDLTEQVKKQNEQHVEFETLKDENQHMQGKLKKDKEEMKKLWLEKDKLEVTLLQEQLTSQRQAREYNVLEDLMKKKQSLQDQMDNDETLKGATLPNRPTDADSTLKADNTRSIAIGTSSTDDIKLPFPEVSGEAHETSKISLNSSGSIFCEKVTMLESEMGRVLGEIDRRLGSRDMVTQVGETSIPNELYRRQEMLRGVIPSPKPRFLDLHKIRTFSAYDAAVERLRAELDEDDKARSVSDRRRLASIKHRSLSSTLPF